MEDKVGAIVRTWTDAFAEALAEAYEPGRAGALLARYRDAFSDGYREAYAPAVAVEDIRDIEALTPERPLGVDFYRAQRGRQALRRPQGLEPRPADPAVGARAGAGEHGLPRGRRADLRGRRRRSDVWLHDMVLERADGGPADLDKLKPALEAASSW